MRSPIKAFDRYATFPVVLFLYGSVGYLSFIQPQLLQFIQLPLAIVSLLAFLAFAWFGRHIQFSSHKASQPFIFSWFLKLWLGLMGLIFISLLIQLVLTNFNPYVARLYISNEAYWQELQPYLSWNSWYYWGYFAALSCWAVGLSYVYYNKQSVPCAHRMAAPLLDKYMPHKRLSIWAKALGESHIYLVTLTWFGLVFLSMVVLLASGILNFFQLRSYFTIPIISMSFFSFVFLFFASTQFSKAIRKLNRIKFDLAGLFIIFSVVVLGLLFLGSLLISLVIQHDPEILKIVECDCTLNKLKMFTEYRMQTLGWAVWILTLPLLSTFVARISEGRRLWQMALGIFSLALLFQLVIYFVRFETFLQFISYGQQTMVQLSVGGGLCLFLLAVFFKQQNSWIFSNGFMKALPRKNDEGIDLYRVSEVSLYDGTKIRGLGIVSRKWAAMCVGMLLVHTIGGWQVVQLELLLFAFLLVLLYFCALLGFFIEWREEGIFSRQKTKI